MSYSFCLLQLVEGAGQLKHPDILYTRKTRPYHLSEHRARTPWTILLPLLHGENLHQDDALKSVACVALLSVTQLPGPSLPAGVSHRDLFDSVSRVTLRYRYALAFLGSDAVAGNC